MQSNNLSRGVSSTHVKIEEKGGIVRGNRAWSGFYTCRIYDRGRASCRSEEESKYSLTELQAKLFNSKPDSDLRHKALVPYGKKEKTKKLKEVRKKHIIGHAKAHQLLMNMGFEIVEEHVISNKPWDFKAKKHGTTYYIDSKAPFSRKKGTFTITRNEIEGMLKARTSGIPAYLLILPDGRSMFLVEE